MFSRFVISLLGLCALVQLIDANAFAYEPPVESLVVDDWRAPVDRYAAGNRGIDYGTTPGEAVAASEGGVVSFVGQVGGTNYVTIDHADGLKTTYGGISSALVTVGEIVTAGLKIALAGEDLHFGVKRDEEYLDPNTLFDQQAHLVTLDAPVRVNASSEVSDETAQWLVNALIEAANFD